MENEAGVTVIIMGKRRKRGTPPRDAKPMSPGSALEQHCANVSRRPYSQPRALRECICLTSHLSQHRGRLPRPFAIEYFNENKVY